MTSTSSDSVVLRGGVTVSLAALRVLWDAEARGLTLRRTDDGRLVVGPRTALTADDLQRLRRHKADLLRLVAYCEAIQ